MPLRWSSSLTRHKLGLLLSAWATAVAPSSSIEFEARSSLSRRVLVISMRAMCLAPSAPRIVSRKSKLCTVLLCASRFASCRVHTSRVCVCVYVFVCVCHECDVRMPTSPLKWKHNARGARIVSAARPLRAARRACASGVRERACMPACLLAHLSACVRACQTLPWCRACLFYK